MRAHFNATPGEVGIGLRPPHFDTVLTERPSVAFFEVHSENYFGNGGALLDTLDIVARDYPISLHGVGLSLGSADTLDLRHLRALDDLVARIQPRWVSEHLCWGAIGARHLNDLLPLPYTEEALQLMAAHVDQVQQALGRQMLIENVSSYLQFTHSTLSEWEFLAALARRSGCGLLLDVNNIYVNSVNHGFDAHEFLAGIPVDSVQEMHLAGFMRKDGLGGPLLIDSHNRRVDGAVWSLYVEALHRFGAVPTLIEWDADLPEFSVLEDEARIAREHMHALDTVAV